jgi:hypothetical protein
MASIASGVFSMLIYPTGSLTDSIGSVMEPTGSLTEPTSSLTEPTDTLTDSTFTSVDITDPQIVDLQVDSEVRVAMPAHRSIAPPPPKQATF